MAQRLAIVGGGIAGLSLAGILSKYPSKFHVHVYERAPRIRDEGYGLDFDDNGQKILQMAGVWDKYWTFSRPRSDVMKFYLVNGERPVAIAYHPNILRKLFPRVFSPKPESNRAAFRKVMLDELATREAFDITFDCKVSDLKDTTNGVELLTPTGALLGNYDMVIDASGVHSVLRSIRLDDPVGKVFAKRVLFHGLIMDPEKSCPQVIDKIEEGTYTVFARGYALTLQRFGADPQDHRSSFFYSVKRDDPDSIFDEIGIAPSTSREQGIIKDEVQLGKMKAWLHKDMGDLFNKSSHDIIDALERLTVRPEFRHGGDKITLRPQPPRMVCVGDSLLNIGLGGGATIAAEDVLDLANILLNSDKIEWDAIRAAEEKMLKRRFKYFNKQAKALDYVLHRPEDKKDSLKFSMMVSAGLWVSEKVCNWWYNWDKRHGGTGSVPEE